MRGCPAVMSIYPELLGKMFPTYPGIVRLRRWSLHLPCLHRTSPCTHPRADAVSSLAVSMSMPLGQPYAQLNTRRQHLAIALNSTSEKCSKKCSRTPARWVGWASPRR